jgi:2-polyprenyl-3-methyl-5-hydroxy-6-metoxy-1,4-benzoquinol methylase
VNRSSLAALIVLALAALVACSEAQPSEARIWKEFLEWYKDQPVAKPPETMSAYRAALAANGLTESEIARRLEVVQKRAAQGPADFVAITFNNIYTSPKPLFSTKPNAFLAETVRELKPGKALDVAMGEGRNAIFLAQQGWDVTGFDVSDKGLAMARAKAKEAGVKINTVLKSQQEFDFGRQQWDLVVLVYAQMPLDTRDFVRRIRESLKPGGRVLVEQFNANPDRRGDKGRPNALLKQFQDFRILRYHDIEEVSDWGLKPARIGRLLAEKT